MKPTRSELNRMIGVDMMAPSTDIATIPCAGIRITHGRLTGLMVWRFVVELDFPAKQAGFQRKSVITNFILDTGSGHSPVPPETLEALGYTGSLRRRFRSAFPLPICNSSCAVSRNRSDVKSARCTHQVRGCLPGGGWQTLFSIHDRGLPDTLLRREA